MKSEKERLLMVRNQLIARGIKDEATLRAMGEVPRELFVPEDRRYQAYADGPACIGDGQTISQPYMVALMTEALEITPTDKVLEIGTGSGYQTAVLAKLAREVVTMERIEGLADKAKTVLNELGYDNIVYVTGDGTKGYPELAPYDGIIVTAGAPHVPEPLKEQLAEGGRIVIPVGDRTFQQCLQVRKTDGRFMEKTLAGCTFVPLLGEEGW